MIIMSEHDPRGFPESPARHRGKLMERASLVLVAIIIVGEILASGMPGVAAEKRNLQQGEALYLEYCLQCHGGRGEGWGWGNKIPPPPIPVPDLSDPKVMTQLSDQYLFDVIKGGGEAVGKSRLMPPAGRVLSDQEIWDVVAYLRSLTQGARESKRK